jgi:hypothetical protein
MTNERIREICDALRAAAQASIWSPYDGRTKYFESCTHRDIVVGMTAIYTRDRYSYGEHAVLGRHLSLSFFNPLTLASRPPDAALSSMVVDNLFAEDRGQLLVESPITSVGRELLVWHYRLFCDSWWRPLALSHPAVEIMRGTLGMRRYSVPSSEGNS